LNAFSERFVRSIEEERLDRIIFFGEASVRHAIMEYIEHCHSSARINGKRTRFHFHKTPPTPCRTLHRLSADKDLVDCCVFSSERMPYDPRMNIFTLRDEFIVERPSYWPMSEPETAGVQSTAVKLPSSFSSI
jgi:hypothetical protein